jgi:hypothetical protein
MHLLGGVDEQEKKSESARGECRKLDRQSANFVQQGRDVGGILIFASSRATSLAKILDCVKRLLSIESPDDAP